jgi:hypothetical protein
MWNRFAFGGWQGHYRRAERWYDRLLRVTDPRQGTGMDEQIDLALAFFQAAYHLRDYLERENVANKQQLDELMASTPALRVCRDLCNGAKHRKITQPSVDPEPWILRSYDPPHWKLVVKVGDMYDLVPLAGDCMRAWRQFLADHNLDPLSLSPPQAALAAALRERDLIDPGM